MKPLAQAIEIRDLEKRFGGIRALADLSLDIAPGKITAIVGPNGSGKSTLINALSGLMPADGGVVRVRGVRLARIKDTEVPMYGITRTFQEARLFEQMTVLDNILVVLTRRGVFASIFERHSDYHLRQAEEVLNRVGLRQKKNDLAANLSYGQRKLLEIARALAMRAEIYLLDEPFAGLFPEMTKTVAGILEDLRRERKTVVLIEHNMELIRQLSDWVFVLDSGELLAAGKPEEVLRKKEVVEAYLGE
jgi:ABC-type branched-subunit amino acid transport system ATPase component